MYNSDALAHSTTALPDQINFLLETRPETKQIVLVDSMSNPKPDYMLGIDAYCINIDGSANTAQFKIRDAGHNDFVLLGKRLSGISATTANIGFMFHGAKYTINNTVDMTIERIAGRDYVVTRDDINAIESCLSLHDSADPYIAGIQPKYVFADDGSKFPSGDYYIFIKLSKLKSMLEGIYHHHNPNLFSI